jgi:hypothetical protein
MNLAFLDGAVIYRKLWERTIAMAINEGSKTILRIVSDDLEGTALLMVDDVVATPF